MDAGYTAALAWGRSAVGSSIRAEDANEVELALIGRWSHWREEAKQEAVSVQEFLAM